MRTPLLLLLLLLLGLFERLPGGAGQLDLYVTRDDMRAVVKSFNGSRVYYIFNSMVNSYALGFSISVPLAVTNLRFHWANRAGHEISYSIGVRVADRHAMGSPRLSIARQGVVPHADTAFNISLPCTGAALAEVPLSILLNVTMQPGALPVRLLIRRRKLCGRGKEQLRLLSEMKPQPANESTIATGPQSADSDGTRSAVSAEAAVAAEANKPAAFVLPLLLPLLLLLLALPAAAAVSYLVLRRCRGINKAGAAAAAARSASADNAALKGHKVALPNSAVVCCPECDSCSLTSGCTSGSQPSHQAGASPIVQRRISSPRDILLEVQTPWQTVSIDCSLMEGNYGRVYRGSWAAPSGRGRETAAEGRHEEVLIKTVAEAGRLDQLSALSQSGVLLAGLQHRHVNPLLASSMPPGDPRPHLIYPYPAGGNLKLRLIGCRTGPPDQMSALSTQQLLHMAVQIGKGLAYLHRMQVVHRDLACRNCVLTADSTVRIADAALAKDLFLADYECTGDGDSRPVKWLAVEALIERKFSPASDVWSLGVTLWELITRCQQPYRRVDPLEMSRHLRDGFRLPKPTNCPDQLFSIMHSCWHSRPDCRPRLKQLQVSLAEFHNTLSAYV